MIDKFIEMTYGEARYEVLKELDTRGPIGSLLQKNCPDLLSTMEFVCRQLEKVMTEDFKIQDLGNIPMNIKETLESILASYPIFILLHSEYNWNTFTSGLILLIKNYNNVALEFYRTCNQEEDWIKQEYKYLARMQELIDATINLINLGAGYLDLLQASAIIVEELKTWRKSRPASMKLSESYLKSLGLNGGQ